MPRWGVVLAVGSALEHHERRLHASRAKQTNVSTTDKNMDNTNQSARKRARSRERAQPSFEGEPRSEDAASDSSGEEPAHASSAAASAQSSDSTSPNSKYSSDGVPAASSGCKAARRGNAAPTRPSWAEPGLGQVPQSAQQMLLPEAVAYLANSSISTYGVGAVQQGAYCSPSEHVSEALDAQHAGTDHSNSSLAGVLLPSRVASTYDVQSLPRVDSHATHSSGLMHGISPSMDSGILAPFAELGSLCSTSYLHTNGSSSVSDFSQNSHCPGGTVMHFLPTRIPSTASAVAAGGNVAAHDGVWSGSSGQTLDAELQSADANSSAAASAAPVRLQEPTL